MRPGLLVELFGLAMFVYLVVLGFAWVVGAQW